MKHIPLWLPLVVKFSNFCFSSLRHSFQACLISMEYKSKYLWRVNVSTLRWYLWKKFLHGSQWCSCLCNYLHYFTVWKAAVFGHDCHELWYLHQWKLLLLLMGLWQVYFTKYRYGCLQLVLQIEMQVKDDKTPFREINHCSLWIPYA